MSALRVNALVRRPSSITAAAAASYASPFVGALAIVVALSNERIDQHLGLLVAALTVLGIAAVALRSILTGVAVLVLGAAAFVDEVFASAMNSETSATQAPTYLAFASKVYDAAGTGLKTSPLALLAIAFVFFSVQQWRMLLAQKWIALSCGLWILASAANTLAIGEGATRVVAAVVPPMLIIAGVFVAYRLDEYLSPTTLRRTLVLLLCVKALQASAVALGIGSHGPDFVLNYDAATPALAGAVLLANLKTGIRTRAAVVLTVDAVVILALTSRRAPIAAIALAAIALLLTTKRVRYGLRLAAVAVLAVMFAPARVRTRLGAAISTLNGQGADASTAGHISDLSVSYRYAVASPLTGRGYDAPQLSGLAAGQASRLYIHNEFLYTWVAGGLVPAVAVAAVVAAAVVAALRSFVSLRDRGVELHRLAAGAFILQLPVLLMFFPYMSTSVRWPLLFGAALGFLRPRGVDGSEAAVHAHGEQLPPRTRRLYP